MRREHLFRLSGVDLETFRSMSKRDELPFARDESREANDYTPNEALMLRAALDLRQGAFPRADVAAAVRQNWQFVWKRAAEIGAPAPDMYLALVTARSDDGWVWCGAEVGTLAEIEALARDSRAEHGVFSPAYAARSYRHRRYWKRAKPQEHCGGGERLAVTSLALSNLSQAFRDLVNSAVRHGVELDDDFLKFFGLDDDFLEVFRRGNA